MKKILIIEDDEAIRNELKTFLCRYNYDTVVVEKFENIIEEIKKEIDIENLQKKGKKMPNLNA